MTDQQRLRNFILALCFLPACGQSERAQQGDTCAGTAYVGDSLAHQAAPYMPGEWDVYAYPGMSLLFNHSEWAGVPRGYCELYVALGTNRASDHAAELANLQTLLDAAPDVICVLPMTVRHVPVEPQRTMLREHCPRYIDHLALGFYPGGSDGTHLGDAANIQQYADILLQ